MSSPLPVRPPGTTNLVLSVYRDHQPYTFNELVAMVRLGHKYQIEDVQEQSMDLLRRYFTDRFDTWEEIVASSRSYPGALFSTCDVHPIGAVQLARLLDEPSMLPVAFYKCAALGCSILDGWTRHDGTVEHLSLEDTKRAIAGYGNLSYDCMPMTERIFDPSPSGLCTSPDICTRGLNNVYEFAKYEVPLSVGGMLNTWSQAIEEELEPWDVCEHCQHALYKREKDQRRRLWCNLPRIFGLRVEGWEKC